MRQTPHLHPPSAQIDRIHRSRLRLANDCVLHDQCPSAQITLHHRPGAGQLPSQGRPGSPSSVYRGCELAATVLHSCTERNGPVHGIFDKLRANHGHELSLPNFDINSPSIFEPISTRLQVLARGSWSTGPPSQRILSHGLCNYRGLHVAQVA